MCSTGFDEPLTALCHQSAALRHGKAVLKPPPVLKPSKLSTSGVFRSNRATSLSAALSTNTRASQRGSSLLGYRVMLSPASPLCRQPHDVLHTVASCRQTSKVLNLHLPCGSAGSRIGYCIQTYCEAAGSTASGLLKQLLVGM